MRSCDPNSSSFQNSCKVGYDGWVSGIDFSQKKKIGFVCSGGAVKAAAFHVGVAMALENIGFQFLGREQEGSGGPFNVNASRTVPLYSQATRTFIIKPPTRDASSQC